MKKIKNLTLYLTLSSSSLSEKEFDTLRSLLERCNEVPYTAFESGLLCLRLDYEE